MDFWYVKIEKILRKRIKRYEEFSSFMFNFVLGLGIFFIMFCLWLQKGE